MNLQQLRFVQEAVRRNLNLTETARALHTSQPGVSKAIRELEQELGVDLFVRHGKRLTRITEPGQAMLASVEAILRVDGELEVWAREKAKVRERWNRHGHARPSRSIRERGPRAQRLREDALWNFSRCNEKYRACLRVRGWGAAFFSLIWGI